MKIVLDLNKEQALSLQSQLLTSDSDSSAAAAGSEAALDSDYCLAKDPDMQRLARSHKPSRWRWAAKGNAEFPARNIKLPVEHCDEVKWEDLFGKSFEDTDYFPAQLEFGDGDIIIPIKSDDMLGMGYSGSSSAGAVFMALLDEDFNVITAVGNKRGAPGNHSAMVNEPGKQQYLVVSTDTNALSFNFYDADNKVEGIYDGIPYHNGS